MKKKTSALIYCLLFALCFTFVGCETMKKWKSGDSTSEETIDGMQEAVDETVEEGQGVVDEMQKTYSEGSY